MRFMLNFLVNPATRLDCIHWILNHEATLRNRVESNMLVVCFLPAKFESLGYHQPCALLARSVANLGSVSRCSTAPRWSIVGGRRQVWCWVRSDSREFEML